MKLERKIAILRKSIAPIVLMIILSALLSLVSLFYFEKDDKGPPSLLLVMMGLVLVYAVINEVGVRLQQQLNRERAATDDRGYFLCVRSFKNRDHHEIA